MSIKSETLQTALLKYLETSKHREGDTRLCVLKREKIQYLLPQDQRPSEQQIMEAIWSLIGQGLAYLNYWQPHPQNWSLLLTESGIAAAQDEASNPDNAGEYLEQLSSKVPDASDLVMEFTREALRSFNSRCYLASTVMLGVASEAGFLEMARSFAKWLPSEQEEKFSQIIESPKTNYISKFLEFRKRVEPRKPDIPNELSDNMSLTLDSVLDLLRINRNDIGHPTGKQISRDDAFINLRMFARYLQKLYELKKVFDSKRMK